MNLSTEQRHTIDGLYRSLCLDQASGRGRGGRCPAFR